MRRFVKSALIAIAITAVGLLSASKAHGQTIHGPVYLWQHSISVGTSPIDSTFTIQWEQVSIWFTDGAGYVRLGAPDTGDWSSRPWIKLPAGTVLSIGPMPHLKRLEFKAVTGTVTLNIVGSKRTRLGG